MAGAQPSVTWGPPVPLGSSPQASCLLAFLLEGGQQRAAAGHAVLVGWDQGVGADTDLQGEGEDPRSKSPHTPRSPGVSVTLGEGEPQGSLCLARHHTFQHRSHCQSSLCTASGRSQNPSLFLSINYNPTSFAGGPMVSRSNTCSPECWVRLGTSAQPIKFHYPYPLCASWPHHSPGPGFPIM